MLKSGDCTGYVTSYFPNSFSSPALFSVSSVPLLACGLPPSLCMVPFLDPSQGLFSLNIRNGSSVYHSWKYSTSMMMSNSFSSPFAPHALVLCTRFIMQTCRVPILPSKGRGFWARDGAHQHHPGYVAFVLHFCGTHRLLSREHASLFSAMHQIEPHFVNVNPVETSFEHFAARGDPIQDIVHSVLVGERLALGDPLLNPGCSHVLVSALRL